eukprot:3161268-Prymnesium_polylepis.1
MSDVLAPQQMAVGVAGGISVLIHGIRVMLEEHPEFVVVRLDLRNAYMWVPDLGLALRGCPGL